MVEASSNVVVKLASTIHGVASVAAPSFAP
jgi:hypothetical protein